MGEPAISTYSYAAYLAMEAEAEQKHEYHGGEITAMAGGTLAHGQIAMNFGRAIGNGLEKAGKACSTFSSDVRVHIQEAKRGFYPDLSVVCGAPETSDQDPQALANPLLVVEVLSPTTAAFDRGTKFAHYRQLKSLREYVLISQNEAMVDVFYRREDDAWEIETYFGLEAKVALLSLGIEVLSADIYRLVEFPSPTSD